MKLSTSSSYTCWNRVCLRKVIGKKIPVIKFSQNKLTKLVFYYYSFSSWLASKSHSAINPPKLKAMHHQSFHFFCKWKHFCSVKHWLDSQHTPCFSLWLLSLRGISPLLHHSSAIGNNAETQGSLFRNNNT